MLASRAPINRLVAMRLPYRLPWHDQRPNGISTFRTAGPIHASQHRSVVVPREAPLPCGCRRCPVCVRACEKPRVFLWGCVGLGRECFGYAKAPWGVCSKGLPVRVMRRRATLPHPVGCSTIAVPGLSFRVRNGTGRLTRAMTTAKPRSRNDSQNTWRPFRPFNYHVAVWEPASGREANAYRLNRIRDHQALIVAWDRSTGKTRNQPSTREGSELLCRRRPLVPVGSTPRGASTSGLSTTCSAWGLQELEGSTECLSWSRLPA